MRRPSANRAAVDRAVATLLLAAMLAAAISVAIVPAWAGKTAPVLNGWTTEVRSGPTPKTDRSGQARMRPDSARAELAIKPAPKPAAAPVAAKRAAKPAAARTAAASPGARAARDYCRNISDAAAEARFAWQKKTLVKLGRQLDERIGRLKAKTVEYRQWLAKRDDFVRKAQGSLVLIYAQMRPDTAAQQLIAMDQATAASLLMKLKPRIASAMLNEMEPARAARLATIIAGAASRQESDDDP